MVQYILLFYNVITHGTVYLTILLRHNSPFICTRYGTVMVQYILLFSYVITVPLSAHVNDTVMVQYIVLYSYVIKVPIHV
jgi:hypothetical protein